MADLAAPRPAWIEALRASEEVNQLVYALSLAERFYFAIVVCGTPRVASAVLEALVDRVSAERGIRVRLVHLDPYEGFEKPGEPLPSERLVDHVLARLVEPTPEERSSAVVFVADASRAHPRDDGAWAEMFRRMNERRNTIVQRLAGPLVLCAPPRLEQMFARAAPDFWSISSLAVVVKAEPPVEVMEKAGDEPEREPRREQPVFGETGEHEKEGAEIRAKVAEARAKAEAAPDDSVALEALAWRLHSLFRHEMRWGVVDRAAQVATDLIAIARQLVGREPKRRMVVHILSLALGDLGEVRTEKGELEAAVRVYEVRVNLSRALAKEEPDRAEWLADLARGLRGLGDALYLQDRRDAAFSAYDETLTLVRDLVGREPGRTEWRHNQATTLGLLADLQVDRGDTGAALRSYEEIAALARDTKKDDVAWDGLLATALSRRGALLQKRGDLDEALKSFEEGLEIARRLATTAPDYTKRRNLMVALGNVGDVQVSRGDLSTARAAYQENLRLTRELMERDPDRTQFLTDGSSTLIGIGRIQRAHGDLEGARAAYDESLRLARRLVKVDPELPAHRNTLARAIAAQGELAEAEGKLPEALAHHRDALAELEPLTSHPTPEEAWLHNASVCRESIARLEAALAAKRPRKRRPKR